MNQEERQRNFCHDKEISTVVFTQFLEIKENGQKTGLFVSTQFNRLNTKWVKRNM